MVGFTGDLGQRSIEVHGEELRWDLKLPMNSQVRNAVEVMVTGLQFCIDRPLMV